MENDEKFKFYFQELKDIYEGYLKFVITMSIAILGSIGWFITSQNAYTFIEKHTFVRWSMIVVIILTILTELYISLNMKNLFSKLSKIVKQAADKINIPEEYYRYRAIKPSMIYILFSFHSLLLILLAIIVSNA